MRTRLSIHLAHILAFGLLLCQLQSALAQKYYMNFAFNNNNPGANGDDDGALRPGVGGAENSEGHSDSNQSVEQVGTSGDDDSDSDDDDDDGDDDNSGNDDDDDDDNSSDGDDEDDSNDDDDDGSSDSESSGGLDPGVDDDNDDSDSYDNPGRRAAMRDALNDKGPDNGHSHHSSYEISIDDSFGGRYVRSIYESSESHGHSGSQPGSGSNDGMDSGDIQKQKDKLYGDDDYEEINDDQ